MNAIAGTDPADPATAEADARRVDYTAVLSPDALRGRADRRDARRFAGFGTDAGCSRQALATRCARRARCWSIRRAPSGAGDRPQRDRRAARRAEARPERLSRDLAPAVPVRTLAELIAFNRAHARREMPLFGQELFEQAEANGGLDDRPIATRARDSPAPGRAEGDRPAAARAQCRRPGRADRPAGLADRRGPWRPQPGGGGATPGRGGRLSAPDRADGRGARAAGRPLLHRPRVGRSRGCSRSAMSYERISAKRRPPTFARRTTPD